MIPAPPPTVVVTAMTPAVAQVVANTGTTQVVSAPGGIPGPPGKPGVTPEWWSGTQTEYNNLDTYDAETLYVITAP